MKRTVLAIALAGASALALAHDAGFRCGGVGQGEQQQFKSEAAQHDAMLTFAVATGAYLSDVDVRITNGRGAVVLEGKCDGPLMLLDLPGHGTYNITATSDGRTQHRAISVGDRPTSSVFTWPAG